jgi:hypothetical protein
MLSGKSIYEEGGFAPKPTHKKYLLVGREDDWETWIGTF